MMQKLHKKALRAGWLVAASILAPAAVAEEAPSNNLKVTVDVAAKATHDFVPYGQDGFSPATIPASVGNKHQHTFFGAGGLGLGLEKTIPWRSQSLRCALGVGLDMQGLSLDQLYVDHDCFLIGLAASNLGDGDALPATLVGDVPCSAIAPTTSQVTWKGQYKSKGIHYALGLEQALAFHFALDKNKNEVTALVPAKSCPALTTAVKYEQASGYVRLGGLIRPLDYFNKKTGATQFWPAGGAHLTSVLHVFPQKTDVKIASVWGMGISSYILDFAGDPEEGGPKGKVQEKAKDVYWQESRDQQSRDLALVGTWGGYIGIEHRWLSQLRSTFVYGLLDTTKDTARHEDAYKQGHYASANLTYHPTEQVVMGVEYLWGRRIGLQQDDQRDAHRLQAAVGFSL